MKKFLVLIVAALLFISCNEDYDYGYSDPWSFSEPAPAPAPRTTDGVRSMTA